jgi:hypothetical protein
MTVVVRFKDEQIEILNGVKGIEYEVGEVKIKSGKSNIALYRCSEIQGIEIVWR